MKRPEPTPTDVIPLTQVAQGEPVTLVQIKAGFLLKRRLAEMGLTPGVVLQVMQNYGGPLLLAVRDTRLAIGRGMAEKILVRR